MPSYDFKCGDIVKITEKGVYIFGCFDRWIDPMADVPGWAIVFVGGESCMVQRYEMSPLTAEIKELFEAYELVCQRLKELEAAYQTLGQEHIDIVNDAQAHLQSPF